MKGSIESLEEQVNESRDFDLPPLDLWHPPLSGSIAIRIDAKGDWYHEDGLIERPSLVRLFASILRRESDDEYYLVTPVEKWRIEVELHPLLVTDIESLEIEGQQVLEATLNIGRQFRVSEQNPLFLDPKTAGIPVLRIPHGLTALCTRAAWYRLADLIEHVSERALLRSGTFTLALPTT